jgi:hypothetical protein
MADITNLSYVIPAKAGIQQAKNQNKRNIRRLFGYYAAKTRRAGCQPPLA